MFNQKIVLDPKYSLRSAVCCLIACSLLVYLGIWQMGRSNYKKDLELKAKQSIEAPAVSFKSLNTPTFDQNRLQHVFANGEMLTQKSFLVDNQTKNKRVGYRLVVPMEIEGFDKVLLIDKGWVPLGKSRAQLPIINKITDQHKFTGVINHIASGIVLKKDYFNATTPWPIVIQAIDYDLISEFLGQPVFDFILQEDVENISFGLSSSKHLGYALQWFSLSILVLTYFIAITFKRRE